MKHVLSILCIGSMCLTTLTGQSYSQLLKNVGIHSGTNVSFLTNSPGEEAQIRYNAGIYYRQNITRALKLIPGLSLQARGVDLGTLFLVPTQEGLLTAEASIKILSVDTPILVRYTFARPDRGWMLSSGPNFSFVANSNMSVTVSTRNETVSDQNGIGDITNTVTYGWIGDLGYKFPAFGSSFVLSMRFKKEFSAQFINSAGAKNNVFSAILGFEF